MIDTAALREKVLDLAIRGKLVPQDPNDEPASVLLERIHEQKLQMVREGKLKAKDVKDDTIIFKGDDNCYYEKFSDGSVKNIQDEIPFDLPAGWAWSRISSIGTTNIGLTYKPTDIANEGTIVLRSSNIKNGKIDLTDLVRVKTIIRENQFVEQNDIVICARNGSKALVGKCAIFNLAKSESVSFGAFMAILRTAFYDYVYYFLNTQLFRNILNSDDSKQINQLTQDMLKNTLIPFPPQNEQRKIVSALNAIIHQISSINNNTHAVEYTKEVLKSRILELAIQGKLVPQDENDEPASVLLERIRAERKAILGKKYVESYIFKGDDNCYYENLPKNWAKCRLSDIAYLERGITFSASAKETIKTEKNLACIRTANVQDELDLDDLIYVDRAYTKNNERKLLRVGDIIMSSANSKELVGKSCIVKHLDGEMTFGGFVLVIRSIQIIPEFLLICLKYLFSKGAFYNESTQTTNIANISAKTIESLEISLPPLMEQQRIIDKIAMLYNILKDRV